MNPMLLPLAAAADKCDKDSSVWNPLCGITPNLGAWGGDLSSKVNVFLSGFWALVLVACAVSVLGSLAQWAWAKNVSHNESDMAAGTKHLKRSGAALGAAVFASGIITAIINIAQ
ncbi:hypothetical protein ACIA49_39040 [Kribbella sp. NPDC051587]|uniref:hypothetical protein n=1 Tax=Kribbella sp. NPDC051587 TaxID=3364119 RepID=UPI00379EF51B